MFCLVFFVTSLAILSLVKDVALQIVTNPQNSAALDSTQVTLECAFSTTNVPLFAQWREFITNSQTGRLISRNTDIVHIDAGRKARYSIISPATGQFNLRINPFTVDDAGFYVCEDDLEQNRTGAYVMYLTRKTCSAKQGGNVVTAVVEGQQFMLQCQRNYRSFEGWPPVLEWSGQTITRNITTATSISYEVDLTANETMHNVVYSCVTTFLDPPPYRTDIPSDTRKPTFTEADCTTQVEVHWPAKNIHRDPDRSSYYPGELVTCKASANPSPKTWSWNKLQGDGQAIASGPTLTITEGMIGESVYECVVTNAVLGTDTVRSQNFTFTVIAIPTTTEPTTEPPVTTMSSAAPEGTQLPGTGSKTEDPQGLAAGAIAGIVIGCLLGLAVIIALIAFFILRKGKDPGTKPTSSSKKPTQGVDQVRGGPGNSYMATDMAYTAPNRAGPPDRPPPYGNGEAPRTLNPDGLHYADLAFSQGTQATVDDTPRSRKPIQMADPNSATVYADIRRV